MRACPTRRGMRLAALLLLATILAGCDKCGDYFWIDTAAPHACKEASAGQ